MHASDTVQRMSSEPMAEHRELTLLGETVRHAVDHVEVFPAPAHVTTVRMTNDELTSMCPVTGQPDLATVEITYRPEK